MDPQVVKIEQIVDSTTNILGNMEDPQIAFANDTNATYKTTPGSIVSRSNGDFHVVAKQCDIDADTLTVSYCSNDFGSLSVHGDVSIDNDPTLDSHAVNLGYLNDQDYVQESSIEGAIYRAGLGNTIFENEGLIVSFNNGARTLTATHTSGTLNAYTENVLYSYANGNANLTSAAIPNVSGIYQFFINSTGVLAGYEITTVTRDMYVKWCFIATVTYDADAGNEISMLYQNHSALANVHHKDEHHNTNGSEYSEGLEPTGLTLNGTTLGISSGICYDDDVRYTVSTVANGSIMPKYYYQGNYATGGYRIRRGPLSANVYVTDIDAGIGSTGRIIYNTFSGSTPVVNTVDTSKFACVHLVVANGVLASHAIICGQAQYSTIELAREGIKNEVATLRGDLFVVRESVYVASFILNHLGRMQYVDTSNNLFYDLRGAFVGGSGASGGTTLIISGTENSIVKIDASGIPVADSKIIVDNSGNVTITGNLTVNGTTSTISTTDLSVKDNIIILNDGESGSGVSSGSSGIRVDRGSSTDASILWDETNDWWKCGIYGAEKRVANIVDSPLGDGVFVWDSSNKVLKTITGFTHTGTLLSVPGNASFSGTVSGATPTSGSHFTTRDYVTGLGYLTTETDTLNTVTTRGNTTSNSISVANLTASGYVSEGGTQLASKYQGLDATLTAMSGVTTAADKLIYFTGVDTASATTITTFGRSLIDDASNSDARTTLGLTGWATNAYTNGSTTDVSEGTNLYFTDARARTAAVADSITDGVTNMAPSQNAVYDALTGKASLSGATFTGSVSVTNTTDSTSTSTGAIVTSGGVGIAKNLYVGETVSASRANCLKFVTDTALYTYNSFALRPTSATSGTRVNYSGYFENKTVVNTGVTESGVSAAINAFAVRNSTAAGADDSGTLATYIGSMIQYGHQNTNASATPQTTTCSGISLYPYYRTGTITNLYGVYIANAVTGGTATNYYGVYQQDTNASNYWAGVSTFAKNTDATSTSTGSIVTSGGIGVARSIYSGGTVTCDSFYKASGKCSGLDGNAIKSITTDTTTTLSTCTLPADILTQGTVISFVARGVIAEGTGGDAHTHTWLFTIGGTTFVSAGTAILDAAATNGFVFSGDVTVLTTGSSGTAVGNGMCLTGAAMAAPYNGSSTNTSSSTINTTTTNVCNLQVTTSGMNGDTITVTSAYIKILK